MTMQTFTHKFLILVLRLSFEHLRGRRVTKIEQVQRKGRQMQNVGVL